MKEVVCIVGLDQPEYAEIRERVDVPIIAHEALPPMFVQGGQLFIESDRTMQMLPVSKVLFHGIYENDLDFITGLALWDGPVLPNAHAMMDCRLKLPCLVKALQYTRFGTSPRGYASPGVTIDAADERVAKWGNWHCGENKVRFSGSWTADEPSIIEHYLDGQAVRVVLIGDRCWQIKLEGDDWLKSIHHDNAAFMEIDPALVSDAEAVRAGFGLELMANDYIVSPDGTPHLLEVNHIPNVTRFPEIWETYRDFAVDWINA
jgi:hypothetical protein